MATKYFTAIGKDGYRMFEDCPWLIDDENGKGHKKHLIHFFESK